MSEKIVNALANMKQVYLEKVGDNNLEKQRLDEELRQITEFKKPKLDPVGKEDKDVNNDKKNDSTDSYFLNKRLEITKDIADRHDDDDDTEENKIIAHLKKLIKSNTKNSSQSADNVLDNFQRIKGIKPEVKESAYYSWRDTVDESLLWEIIDDVEQKQVKEKTVNNYATKNPVVTVNPDIKTESVLIDSEELNEAFIEESINIATEYLCEEGLSVDDIKDLINELGVEEFSEWVMQLGYETLLDEQQSLQGELLTVKGQPRKKPEVSKRLGAATVVTHTPKKSSEDKPEPVRSSSGQMSLNLTPKAVRRTRKHGKVTQGPRTTKPDQTKPTIPEKKGPNPEVKKMVRGALDAAARMALSAGKGHQTAMEIKKKGGTLAQQLGGGAGAALGSFFKRGTSQFKEWVENLLEEGYDLSEYTWDELYEEYEEIQEKAVSEQQQKLFGLALSVKRGETSREKVSPEVLKIVDDMSEKEIRKYAATSHEGIPEKLAEKIIQFVRESR
jgi:hypothetical protein